MFVVGSGMGVDTGIALLLYWVCLVKERRVLLSVQESLFCLVLCGILDHSD